VPTGPLPLPDSGSAEAAKTRGTLSTVLTSLTRKRIKPGKQPPPQRRSNPMKHATKVVTVPVKVDYPATDEQGDALINITGSWVYLRMPGSRELVRTKFGGYGENNDTVLLELTEDGAYGVATTVVTECRESELSPIQELVVNVLPPKTPVPPEILVPCPQDQSRGALIEIGITYPADDIQGSRLLKIQGAEVEVILPGANPGDSTNPIQWVEWPQQDTIIRVAQDGSYRLRYRIVGACARSEWSDAVPVGINMQPAARPNAPTAVVPCSLAPKPGA